MMRLFQFVMRMEIFYQCSAIMTLMNVGVLMKVEDISREQKLKMANQIVLVIVSVFIKAKLLFKPLPCYFFLLHVGMLKYDNDWNANDRLKSKRIAWNRALRKNFVRDIVYSGCLFVGLSCCYTHCL